MTGQPHDVEGVSGCRGISLIIPTFNRVNILGRCLEAVLSQEKAADFEIIVSLDARDQRSEDFLAAYRERIVVARSEIPGSNAARNRGVLASHGKIIIFIDDDCILPRIDWVLKVAALFERYSEADVIGGYYLSENNARLSVRCRNQMSNAYAADSLRSALESRVLLGGNSAYRKEVFSKWGLFDEVLRYGAAETELNERIMAAGGKLYLFEELSVVHAMIPRSLSRYCCQAFLQGRGWAYTYSKNKTYPYAGRGLWATASYLCSIVRVQGSLFEQAGAIIYILSHVVSYKAGVCWGRAVGGMKLFIAE